ncbi:MAG: DUF262 domain-containing protein [Roseitalea sp.]|nr:DUF262 domain-containing protein [Roseitalea sp.]MBO6721233.1 DUF262 domain-containing protein [Roseitalea sp.]MBO6742283.1 DUF262 domain-containing protein [Roseitalea sp.]
MLTNEEHEPDGEMTFDVDNEDNEQFVSFDLNIYPSDYTLKGLADMWGDSEIEVPDFQRNFVWTIKQSSLLIESFLLGLPVPQVFFYVSEDEKRMVIDGLQRVSSIVFFFEGYFGVETAQGRRQVFRLTGLDEKSPYAKKRFVDLSDEDQRKLRNTVMRVVNIKQLAPTDDDTSMYYVFERLNTGGTPLRPQEIRNCVFSGNIVKELRELNALPQWRSVIGRQKPEKHQRDVEIILRTFSFFKSGDDYEKPMKSFLNKAMAENRSAKTKAFKDFKSAFMLVTKELLDQVGERPFHVRGPINLAALDSVYFALIPKSKKLPANLKEKISALYEDEEYRQAIFFNTSDGVTVEKRLKLAVKYLQ